VVALAAWFVGIALGWIELVVLALGLATALVVAVPFILGRSTYAVAIDFARIRVKVGTDAFGGLTIANTSNRAVLSSLFLLPVGKGLARFHVPRLAGGATHEEAFQIPTQRRAVIALGPVRSSRGDPLGLLRRDLTWTEQQELFVHPQTVSLEGSSSGLLKDMEGRPTDDLSSSDIAFHALRDYVVGDDLRHIHWKTSARIGKLMVRQFEETRRSHLVVCLSMAPEDYVSEDAFELAASVAASLGQQSIRDDRDLTIATSSLFLHTETGMRMLDDFSRLEFGPPTKSIRQVASEAAAAVLDASVAVLVTGTTPTAAVLHSAIIRFPVDVSTIVVRCEPGLPTARSAIANSPVLTVGDLDGFPRAMRSVGN
jgi:uncharacterized protein (DUF58 family)